MIGQTTFKECFSYLAEFVFWPRKWTDSSNIVEVKTFFFGDYNIAGAKLFFDVPTQLDMMIDNTVRIVCVDFVEGMF